MKLKKKKKNEKGELLISNNLGDFLIYEYYFGLNHVKKISYIDNRDDQESRTSYNLIKEYLEFYHKELEIKYCKNESKYQFYKSYIEKLIKLKKNIPFKLNNFKFQLNNINSNYFVIVPFTTSLSANIRNFNYNDFEKTIKYLECNKKIGIILGKKEDYEKELQNFNNKLIINLINKTSLKESIEILLCAIGYIGIDSFLSVIASKYIRKENLFIKRINENSIINGSFFYHPLKSNEIKFL